MDRTLWILKLLFLPGIGHVHFHDEKQTEKLFHPYNLQPYKIYKKHNFHLVHLPIFRNLAMDQYLYIPFLGEWTSIYQLFWCSPGVQGLDTLPFLHLKRPISCHRHRSPSCSREQILKGDLVAIRQTDRHIWEIQRHIVLEGCRAGRADPQGPGNVATSRPKIWSFLMVLMKKWDIRWHLIVNHIKPTHSIIHVMTPC